jgi:hypothetical protein
MLVEVDSIVEADSTGESFTARTRADSPHRTPRPAIIPGHSEALIMEAQPEASPLAGSQASAEDFTVGEDFTVVAAGMVAAGTANSALVNNQDN